MSDDKIDFIKGFHNFFLINVDEFQVESRGERDKRTAHNSVVPNTLVSIPTSHIKLEVFLRASGNSPSINKKKLNLLRVYAVSLFWFYVMCGQFRYRVYYSLKRCDSLNHLKSILGLMEWNKFLFESGFPLHRIFFAIR